jgi:hypothetical protein
VDDVGFEPTMHIVQYDLKSYALNHSANHPIYNRKIKQSNPPIYLLTT